jgi:beta-glucosidase
VGAQSQSGQIKGILVNRLSWAALAGCVLLVTAAFADTNPPFRDPSLPLGTRVNDLVSRLTLEEKASQMMHAAAPIPRLGIPAYNWWSEGLHGVAATGYATVFPQSIGLAATFDPELLHSDAKVIATEFRAKYHEELRTKGFTGWFHGLTIWSPNVNIFRDPRWGRGQETYGEDPFLTAQMGVAFVTGLQGEDPKYLAALSTPKHFAVHSGPESTRHSADVAVSAHDLEDTYLPAFRATVLAGANSVMCAYNSINGKPACAQPLLLQDHLRHDWDFDGYVVSDCGAASDIFRNHKYTATMAEGMAAAVKSGMDLICTWPEAAVKEESAALAAAVRQGLLPEADMDRAVRRLFTARMKLGMFDSPASVPYSTIPASENDTEAHRDLALRTARESLVLLKNAGSLLPLANRYKNIAVVGPNADNVGALVGNYNGTPSHPVTLLEGIRKRFTNAVVTYAQGSSLIGVSLAPIDAQFLQTSSGAPGLTADYFQGSEFREPRAFERTDSEVDFRWQERAAPDLGGEFSARWTGTLKAPVSGDYEIGYSGTGSFRVWFKDHLVGETAFAGSGKTVSQHFQLQAGATYPVRIESAQKGPGGHARLLWHRPDAGKDYTDAVRKADLVIAVLGLTSELEGEEMPIKIPGFQGGDRTSLDLPQAQQQLLTDLAARGKPVILVLMNGSALAVNWADKHVAAILEAWYPGGQGGTAIAAALAGDFSPGGKLPVTFYRSVDQLPPFEDYAMKGRTYRYFSGVPLYPFGYGLTYSRFAFSNLRFDHATLGASDELNVTVDVSNTGKIASDEVVQVYLAQPGEAGAPIRTLAGFRRLSLRAGELKSVSIPIANRNLSFVAPDGTRRINPGTLRVWVGEGQPDIRAGLHEAAGIAGAVTLSAGSVLPN